MPWDFDYLVVGAGFAGSVLAERLSSQQNKRCLVIDRRHHIAGNAYDAQDQAGVLLHRYGAHYFRTNSEKILRYLSQFTEWREVEYRILSWAAGQYWSFPINLKTFEQLLGRASDSAEMEQMLSNWRVKNGVPRNSEEMVLSQVGSKLYEMFFKNYTRKQWGRDAVDLDASVCGRIPVRTSRDDRYVSERFQVMPAAGYTKMFERMLSHPNIKVLLNTDFREVLPQVRFKHLIYTGPVDEYFNCCYGPLPYRSMRFEWETKAQEFHQPVVQVNYPNDYEFTRIIEIKHVTGQQLPVTTIMREFPRQYMPGGEPFYPIPAPDTAALYSKYRARALAERNVSFVGRLATYRYYNMDQVVGMALTEYEKLAAKTI